MYQKPEIETFWKAGDEEKDVDPDYKVWVYDIECSPKSTTETTLHFKTTEDGTFKEVDHKVVVFEQDVTVHTPNLLVFRNVFDDESETIFFGEDCVTRFIQFLLNANQGRNIAIAHNGSGYDTRLIHEAVLSYSEPLQLKVIRRGLKFLQLQVEKIKFRDSFLFLPSSLSALAKSFDLPLKKGTFPHMFNRPENYTYEGQIPPKRYFDLTFFAKTNKDIEEFNKWYDERSKQPWNFMHELVEYCRDDVKILAMLVKLFHNICVEKFQHSPWSSVTAPSYVHKVVIQTISESMDMPEDPEDRIQVINQTREKWSVLTPSEYWFVRNCLRGGRTDARRLHFELTDEEIARGLKIKYVDVVSMYPAVQVKYPYPIGAPIVHIYDKAFYPCFKHQNPEKGNSIRNCSCSYEERQNSRMQMDIVVHDAQPTREELLKHFGFICVSCIPNKHLYHPTLVSWDEESQKCVASLEEIVEGYFTTEEFKVALENGYEIVKIHRVDAYEKADGLWNDFIKDLYIEKLANSGPPPDNGDRVRIKDGYEQQFGMGDLVEESFDRWKYDGALRTVYKTLLNCGWGKHCQRPNSDQHIIFNTDKDGPELFEDLHAGLIRASKIELLDNGYQIYTIKNTSSTVLNCHNSYIPAGCYVPAYGRLTLLKEMNKLGKRVLYHDTDSIVYIYDPELYNIPESDIWGCWDEEKISKQGIKEFVALGPKSYGIKTANESIIKLKGLSIKHSHKNLVNFDVLKNFLVEHQLGNYPIVELPQMQFKYKIGEGIKTLNFLKKLKFSPENLKGNLTDLLEVYPKGYCEKCFKGEHCE